MKADTFHKQARRLAPLAALCVLSLITAMVFAVPSAVFAQITAELSQECDFALAGGEGHTITAKVTPADATELFFCSLNPLCAQSSAASLDENGIATFSYSLESPQTDPVMIGLFNFDAYLAGTPIATIATTWTANAEDLLSCMEPSSQTVNVGGRGKLNVKKKGSMRIMICSDGELDLYSVDPETVTLAGVTPESWKYKDRKFCPGGKDGFVDLVFKFKNKKIVEALEGLLAGELEDGLKDVPLTLAGSLDDGTALEGTYLVDIINKSKKARKCKKVKKHKKKKMAKK